MRLVALVVAQALTRTTCCRGRDLALWVRYFELARWIDRLTKRPINLSILRRDIPLWESLPTPPLARSTPEQSWTSESTPKVSKVIHIPIYEQIDLIQLWRQMRMTPGFRGSRRTTTRPEIKDFRACWKPRLPPLWLVAMKTRMSQQVSDACYRGRYSFGPASPSEWNTGDADKEGNEPVEVSRGMR